MKTKCEKCGYESEINKEIKVDDKNEFNKPIYLCSVCVKFAPNEIADLLEYLKEKMDSDVLDTFRKHTPLVGQKLKTGMLKKAEKGDVVSRAPFGYKIINKKLVPAENFREIEEIFEEFLREKISLNQLAQKHNLTVNGLKKILTNFTYIGKVKFNGEIHQGNHQPIISNTLFNHVQNKLSRILKSE